MHCPTLIELPPPPDAVTVWPWTRASAPLPPLMPGGEPWPLISIVTPSLNQGRFLEQAIRSVLLQGYPRLELVVVDGGSGDESPDILARYAPWLKHWQSAPDRGPADALNTGFKFAEGRILAVLNADDFYLPGCLGKVAQQFAALPSADVVSGHGYFARASGELGVPTFSDRWDLQRFRHGACVLMQQATFFRRAMFERVGGFRENARLCWDMELWADMALAGASFHGLDEFIAAFRLHRASISGREDCRAKRRANARDVMAQIAGRPETMTDWWLQCLYRGLKFSKHPGRTLRQRVFFYSTLKRWSL
jgi:glycosyltransferase involved in cell wall biosynthesis